MTVQSLPKVNVMQKAGTSTINTANLQQQLVSGAQIVTAGSAVNQGGKTALIGTNVVKLVSPSAVSGNKILMKNSNLVQVGKVGATAGKPQFVITNKQGQTIRTNQQIIFVTTASGLRTVQTGSIVTSSANNFVSLVSSPHVNTITSAVASGANSIQTASQGTVKMIRSVGQQGKPITFTLPVSNLQGNKSGQPQLISMPQKCLTIGGKAVTVQLAPGNQKTVTIVSSAGGGIQKRITNLSNVITHKAIPMSASQITDASNDPNAHDSQDNNLMEGSHLEVLDQLDGAFDIDSDSDSESLNNVPMHSHRQRQLVTQQSIKASERNLMRGAGVHKSYQRSIGTKTLKKTLPKYVKMGLFGGQPFNDNDSIEQPESTTDQGTDGGTNDGENVDMVGGSGHIDTSSTDADGNSIQSTDDENQITTDQHPKNTNEAASSNDGSADYINTSGLESSAGDEYLNSEAEQKPQQSSGRHTEPTPSDTEAANILTTIKSGDLLRNNDKSDNSVTTTMAIKTLASPTSTSNQENVKILFNATATTAHERYIGLPTLTTSTTTNIVKTVQKTPATTFSNSNTGDLDALASAALQASTGKFVRWFCLFFSAVLNELIIGKILLLNDFRWRGK